MADVNAKKVILKDVKTGTYILPYVDTSVIESEVSDLKTALDGKQDTLPDNQLIYWATYGTSTYKEVKQANDNGQFVLLFLNGILHTIGVASFDVVIFQALIQASGQYQFVKLKASDSTWSTDIVTFEKTSNRLRTSSTEASTNFNYYSALKTDTLLSAKADSSDVYTKTEIDDKFASLGGITYEEY